MITKDKIEQIIKINGVVFVNDLTDNFEKSNFIDIINQLHNMGINNQKIKIKVYCKECGKELIIRPSEYKKQKHFRCDEHIKHKRSGKNSPFYNRIDVNCTNCGRLYPVTPYDYNKRNKFGDNHNFCCQQCYWEYRSKYYVKEKSNMFGVPQSEENKAKQRDLAIRMIANGELPQTMTKPHKVISELLQEHNIEVENEHSEKYHSIDIYLPEYNLMIEIMGDYWHANPLKYDSINLTKQQKKSIKQDKSKHTYIKKYKDIEILYLWEQDIKKNIDLCWLLIREYICQDGILNNYHSLNYCVDNDMLRLNDIIVLPFQDNKSIEQFKAVV
jgi:G:T-mismatch repair DNA endonuclease (very short patch repair protein)